MVKVILHSSTSYSAPSADALKASLRACPHLPLATIPELTAEFRVQWAASRLLGALETGAELWRCVDRKADVGLAVLDPLPHETRHFGFPCARIGFLDSWAAGEGRGAALEALLDALLSHARQREVRLVWMQSPTRDYELQGALGNFGFRFADAVMDWVGRPSRLAPSTPTDIVITEEVVGDEIAALERMAESSMEFHRFATDPRFPPGGIRSLYREVAHRCLDGTLADGRLVARAPGGTPLGFAALQWIARRSQGAPLSIGHFRFLVRHPSAPAGTGPALLDAGCEWFAEENADVILAQTVIQNSGMIRSALAKGFRVEDSRYDWFWWNR